MNTHYTGCASDPTTESATRVETDKQQRPAAVRQHPHCRRRIGPTRRGSQESTGAHQTRPTRSEPRRCSELRKQSHSTPPARKIRGRGALRDRLDVTFFSPPGVKRTRSDCFGSRVSTRSRRRNQGCPSDGHPLKTMNLLGRKMLKAHVRPFVGNDRLIRLRIGADVFVMDRDEAIDLARQLVAAVDKANSAGEVVDGLR